jgi:hypothetical protein
MRQPWTLPSPSALKIHDPKMKVDPARKNMLSRSRMQICQKPLPGASAIDVLPPIAYHRGT